MKPLFSIVWKDARRVRWYLALWTGLLGVRIAVGLFHLLVTNTLSRDIANIVTVVDIAGHIVSALIAAIVIHEDVLIGSRAHWMTRPISRWRLLSAKVTSVGLLTVVVPVALHVPWWLGFRFSAVDFGWAALETAGRQLAFVLPAMMMAALTNTFSRVIVWSLVLSIALLMSNGFALFLTKHSSGLSLSRGVVQLGALAAVAVIVVLTQYLWRRVWAGVVLLVVGLLGAGYLGVHWPIDFFGATEGAPLGDFRPELGRDVRLSYVSAAHGRTVPSRSRGYSGIYVQLDLKGVPAGYFLRAGHSVATLVWPSGLTTRYGTFIHIPWPHGGFEAALGLKARSPDEESQRWNEMKREELRRTQPGREELRRRPQAIAEVRARETVQPNAALVLREKMVDLVKTHQPAYTLAAELHLMEPVKLREIRLERGAWAVSDGHFVRIHRRERRLATTRRSQEYPPRDVITVRATTAVPVLLREGPSRRFAQERRWFALLIDRNSNESIGSTNVRGVQVAVGCVGIAHHDWEFSEAHLRRGETWVPRDPSLLDHAALVLVKWRDVARFSREIAVEHLVLSEPPSKE